MCGIGSGGEGDIQGVRYFRSSQFLGSLLVLNIALIKTILQTRQW